MVVIIRQYHPIGEIIPERTTNNNIMIPTNHRHIGVISRLSRYTNNLCVFTIFTWMFDILSYVFTVNSFYIVDAFASIIGFYGGYFYSHCALNIFRLYQYISFFAKSYILLVLIPNYTPSIILLFCADATVFCIIISMINTINSDILKIYAIESPPDRRIEAA